MGGYMKIVETNRVLLEKIIRIRKGTELNQESFCKKYLAPLIPNELNKGSSLQSFMTKLENGYILFPACFLPVYAKVGRCSIEELLDGNASDCNLSIADALTYSDALHILDALVSTLRISVDMDTVKSSKHEYHLNRAIITLLDGNLDSLFGDYMHIRRSISNIDEETARTLLDLYMDKIARSEEGKRPMIPSQTA